MIDFPIVAGRRRMLRRLAAAGLLIAGLGGRAPTRAQGLSEREIKVAYLFNFARFGEWPADTFASPAAPFRLCALGATALAPALQQLDGRPLRDRVLSVRSDVNLDAIVACHLVFVAESERVRLPAVRAAADRAPVLIVGEGDEALERGAAIAFRPVERKLGFVVDLPALRRCGVRLPAQLLALAVEVRS